MEKHRDPIIEEIVRLCGSQTNLSRHLNISRQAVCQWRVVPARYVAKISFLTGISRERIRPDIFGEIVTAA
jgi:DNA-binding transcriptional regulator YdaS (Cro superfamily)